MTHNKKKRNAFTIVIVIVISVAAVLISIAAFMIKRAEVPRDPQGSENQVDGDSNNSSSDSSNGEAPRERLDLPEHWIVHSDVIAVEKDQKTTLEIAFYLNRNEENKEIFDTVMAHVEKITCKFNWQIGYDFDIKEVEMYVRGADGYPSESFEMKKKTLFEFYPGDKFDSGYVQYWVRFYVDAEFAEQIDDLLRDAPDFEWNPITPITLNPPYGLDFTVDDGKITFVNEKNLKYYETSITRLYEAILTYSEQK